MHEHPDKRDEQIKQIKAWLLSKKKSFEGDLDMDMDLIERRVIDSLKFMEFLLFLEEITGRELSADPKTIASLRTLRNIRDHVL
jgi:acyl carrier protein